jgi:hypothetical protein
MKRQHHLVPNLKQTLTSSLKKQKKKKRYCITPTAVLLKYEEEPEDKISAIIQSGNKKEEDTSTMGNEQSSTHDQRKKRDVPDTAKTPSAPVPASPVPAMIVDTSLMDSTGSGMHESKSTNSFGGLSNDLLGGSVLVGSFPGTSIPQLDSDDDDEFEAILPNVQRRRRSSLSSAAMNGSKAGMNVDRISAQRLAQHHLYLTGMCLAYARRREGENMEDVHSSDLEHIVDSDLGPASSNINGPYPSEYVCFYLFFSCFTTFCFIISDPPFCSVPPFGSIWKTWCSWRTATPEDDVSTCTTTQRLLSEVMINSIQQDAALHDYLYAICWAPELDMITVVLGASAPTKLRKMGRGWTDYKCESSSAEDESFVVDSCWGDDILGETSLLEAILEEVQDQRCSQLSVVGHGAGGALAAIFGVWAATRTEKKVSVYSFGAPRVGDVRCEKLHDRLVEEGRLVHVRFVNTKDGMTRRPSSLMTSPYRAVGTPVTFSNKKNAGIDGYWQHLQGNNWANSHLPLQDWCNGATAATKRKNRMWYRIWVVVGLALVVYVPLVVLTMIQPQLQRFQEKQQGTGDSRTLHPEPTASTVSQAECDSSIVSASETTANITNIVEEVELQEKNVEAGFPGDEEEEVVQEDTTVESDVDLVSVNMAVDQKPEPEEEVPIEKTEGEEDVSGGETDITEDPVALVEEGNDIEMQTESMNHEEDAEAPESEAAPVVEEEAVDADVVEDVSDGANEITGEQVELVNEEEVQTTSTHREEDVDASDDELTPVVEEETVDAEVMLEDVGHEELYGSDEKDNVIEEMETPIVEDEVQDDAVHEDSTVNMDEIAEEPQAATVDRAVGLLVDESVEGVIPTPADAELEDAGSNVQEDEQSDEGTAYAPSPDSVPVHVTIDPEDVDQVLETTAINVESDTSEEVVEIQIETDTEAVVAESQGEGGSVVVKSFQPRPNLASSPALASACSFVQSQSERRRIEFIFGLWETKGWYEKQPAFEKEIQLAAKFMVDEAFQRNGVSLPL